MSEPLILVITLMNYDAPPPRRNSPRTGYVLEISSCYGALPLSFQERGSRGEFITGLLKIDTSYYPVGFLPDTIDLLFKPYVTPIV